MIHGAGKIIATNATASYLRSLVALALGLFASRWTLQALGASDFGISVTVGALIAFGTLLGDLLRFSVLRHLAFAVGSNRREILNEFMRAAVAAHLALALVACAFLWPIGEWAIRSAVRIPPDRISAAITMFRCSLAMFFITTATVPFCAIFTAHQRFITPSIINSLRALWLFAWAYWLTESTADRLEAFAYYSLAGLVLAQASLIILSRFRFGSLDLKLGVNWRTVGKIASFAGWNVFGGTGFLIATQGTAFVTNKFFGTIGNAAYGLAIQVQTHAEALSNSLTGAFAPAITSRQGSGDPKGMRQLAINAGLLSPLLSAFFTIPLIAEIEKVLELWLGNPPPSASSVCTIILLSSFFNKLTLAQQLAINADGRIAKVQIATFIAHSVALPVAITLSICGCGIISAAVAYTASALLCLIFNLYYGSKTAGLSATKWARETLLPLSIIVPLALAAAFAPRLMMASGILRLITTSALSSAVFIIALLYLALKWTRSK